MVTKKTWAEFRATGLLLFINTFLHIFGWCIVVEVNDDGSIADAYPARVKFRGFEGDDQTEAYRKLSQFMVDNAEELSKEAKM